MNGWLRILRSAEEGIWNVDSSLCSRSSVPSVSSVVGFSEKQTPEETRLAVEALEVYKSQQ